MDIITVQSNTEQKNLKEIMVDFAAAILLDLIDYNHPAGTIFEGGGMRIEVLSESPQYLIKVNYQEIERVYVKR